MSARGPIRLEDVSPRLREAIAAADSRMRAAAGVPEDQPVAIRTSSDALRGLWVGQPITAEDADIYASICAQHTVMLIAQGGDPIELMVGLVARSLLVGLLIDRGETT